MTVRLGALDCKGIRETLCGRIIRGARGCFSWAFIGSWKGRLGGANKCIIGSSFFDYKRGKIRWDRAWGGGTRYHFENRYIDIIGQCIIFFISRWFRPLVRSSALPGTQNQSDDLVDAFPVLDFREDSWAAVSVVDGKGS